MLASYMKNHVRAVASFLLSFQDPPQKAELANYIFLKRRYEKLAHANNGQALSAISHTHHVKRNTSALCRYKRWRIYVCLHMCLPLALKDHGYPITLWSLYMYPGTFATTMRVAALVTIYKTQNEKVIAACCVVWTLA